MMKSAGHKMMVFMSKRMIACDEASFFISYKEDNRLGLKKWWQLKFHLLTCHLCRKYAIQIDQLHETVADYRQHSKNEPCHHHLSAESGVRLQGVVNDELNVN